MAIYSNYLQAYADCLNPTYFYLNKQGYKKETNKIEQLGHALSLEERITLGLKIDELEKIKLVNQQVALRRKIYREDLVG